MTRQDFILGTLEPYFIDPSTCSIDKDGNCLYLSYNGNKCAIGKHILPEAYDRDMEETDADAVLRDYDCLTDEAKEQNLTPTQWRLIQRVHDLWAKHCKGLEKWDVVEFAIRTCEDQCNVDLSKLRNYVTEELL